MAWCYPPLHFSALCIYPVLKYGSLVRGNIDHSGAVASNLFSTGFEEVLRSLARHVLERRQRLLYNLADISQFARVSNKR